MFFALLSHLPALALELIAAALLVVAIGVISIVFAVLISELACRRIIRLLHAIGGIIHEGNAQQTRRKRHQDKE